MRAAAALLAAGLLLPWRASAQSAPAIEGIRGFEPPAGLIGLLTPPLVADGPPGCHRIATRTRLAVFDAPGGHGHRLGELRFVPWAESTTDCNSVHPRFTDEAGTPKPIPEFESGYEENALPVLEHHGDWYRIPLNDGDGWIHAPPGFRYDSLDRLLFHGLTYLTGAWEGRLCDLPDASTCRAFAGTEHDVRVLEARELDGMRWWRIQILTPHCQEGEGVALAGGWIPAYGHERRPTVWFWSRGC